MHRMKNKLRKVCITVALVLTPAFAANSAMAAPCGNEQAPNYRLEQDSFSHNPFTLTHGLLSNLLSFPRLGEQHSKFCNTDRKSCSTDNKPYNTLNNVCDTSFNTYTYDNTDIDDDNCFDYPCTIIDSSSCPTPRRVTDYRPNYPGNRIGEAGSAKGNFDNAVLALSNQERAKEGVPPLQLDSKLSTVAMMKAKDMVENRYYDHYSPTYGLVSKLLNFQGIQYSAWAENLVMSSTPKGAVQAWMGSSGHRQYIMNPKFKLMGAATYKGVCVQIFIG